MVVPFNFRLICLKLGVELEMENKKIIDDRLCVCLAKLNILVELEDANPDRDHVTFTATVTRVANESVLTCIFQMASAAIKSSVAGLLVIVFCTAGIVKITDKIAPEIHKQMVSESTVCCCVNEYSATINSLETTERALLTSLKMSNYGTRMIRNLS